MDGHPDIAGGQAPLRALVVDDEPPLVRLVTAYLEREGFQVQAAGDGLQAVELARTFQPEVIVLDLMLPRMDGIEACRQIRTFSDAYVVMLTARTEEVDKLVGLGVGADDYLTKPFSPRELVARIRAMLRRPRAAAGGAQPPSAPGARLGRRLGRRRPPGRRAHRQPAPQARRRPPRSPSHPDGPRGRLSNGRRQVSGLAGRVRGSLGAKLLLAQMLVVIAGSLTLAVVALAVAPGVFHAHVRMALGVVPPETARHLDEGLAKAITVALGTGTGVAVATALGVSFLLARRITSPIRSLDHAAGRVARGRYTARVPVPAGGDELARLAAAFNTMAEALEASEQRRTELLADLAHELRTPLATIDGYLEGVADGVIAPDDAILPVLQTETARLRRLVDDLNAVSRAEERQLDLHPVRCDSDKLLTTAVQAGQAAYAAKKVTLTRTIDRHLPQVMVDPDRMGEVLANLLGNAFRHTPSGGSVEVADRPHAAHRAAPSGCRRCAHHAVATTPAATAAPTPTGTTGRPAAGGRRVNATPVVCAGSSR